MLGQPSLDLYLLPALNVVEADDHIDADGFPATRRTRKVQVGSDEGIAFQRRFEQRDEPAAHFGRRCQPGMQLLTAPVARSQPLVNRRKAELRHQRLDGAERLRRAGFPEDTSRVPGVAIGAFLKPA